MSDGPLLLVEGLRAMRGRRLALEDIGFSLSPGDRIFLDGENGSGKTTLLEALLGLLPSTAHRRVWLGRPGTPAQLGAFEAGSVGYLPQFNNLFPSLPIRANLFLGSTLGPKQQSVVLDQIVADFPEFDPLLARRPSACSGGQRQLAALFRVLMHAPALLMLDEPVAGVAIENAKRAFALIGSLAPRDCAIVFTDHQKLGQTLLAANTMHIERGNLSSS